METIFVFHPTLAIRLKLRRCKRLSIGSARGGLLVAIDTLATDSLTAEVIEEDIVSLYPKVF